MFAGDFQESLDVAKLEILRISPVLGVHTGPGIVGATVVPYRLMEEIQPHGESSGAELRVQIGGAGCLQVTFEQNLGRVSGVRDGDAQSHPLAS